MGFKGAKQYERDGLGRYDLSQYHEDALTAEAATILGDGAEPPIAAGVFGLQDLTLAAMGGALAGGIAGDAVGSSTVGDVSAVAGSHIAAREYAESQGVTLQMIVAVTEHHIHVLNRGTDGRLRDRVVDFDRETCEVTIRKFGLSRHIELRDPANGASIRLQGSTSPISALAKADKVVLHLLAG